MIKNFLPYQLNWIKDAAPLKIWVHARQVGATHAESFKTTSLAIDGISTAWYTLPSLIRHSAESCAGWATKFGIQAERSLLERHLYLKFPSIGSIWFGDDIRQEPKGIKIDRIVLEEAAWMEGFNRNMFRQTYPFNSLPVSVISAWGDENIENKESPFLWDQHHPQGQTNAFNDFARDVKRGILQGSGQRGSLHVTDFDHAIADGIYKRICALSATPWSAELEQEWRFDFITALDFHWRKEIMEKHGVDRLEQELQRYGGYGPSAWRELFCGGIGRNENLATT